jgi:hypothetical protein
MQITSSWRIFACSSPLSNDERDRKARGGVNERGLMRHLTATYIDSSGYSKVKSTENLLSAVVRETLCIVRSCNDQRQLAKNTSMLRIEYARTDYSGAINQRQRFGKLDAF